MIRLSKGMLLLPLSFALICSTLSLPTVAVDEQQADENADMDKDAAKEVPNVAEEKNSSDESPLKDDAPEDSASEESLRDKRQLMSPELQLAMQQQYQLPAGLPLPYGLPQPYPAAAAAVIPGAELPLAGLMAPALGLPGYSGLLPPQGPAYLPPPLLEPLLTLELMFPNLRGHPAELPMLHLLLGGDLAGVAGRGASLAANTKGGYPYRQPFPYFHRR